MLLVEWMLCVCVFFFNEICVWLSAGEISQEVEKFIKDERNAKKKCFFKLCPNLISRHQLRRQAKKKAEDVKKIQ